MCNTKTKPDRNGLSSVTTRVKSSPRKRRLEHTLAHYHLKVKAEKEAIAYRIQLYLHVKDLV